MNYKKPKFWDKKTNSLFSIVLYPISIIYYFFFQINKQKPPSSYKIPIICVGNLYLGGTGKTPLVKILCKILEDFSKKPAVVKKQYNYLTDEINFLKNYVKIYIAKNRRHCINNLIRDNHNVAVLDDGFQDNSIKKDLNIICFNEKQWIGNGQMIPSGPLREPLSSLSRSQCVIINGKKNLQKEKFLKQYNSSIRIFYTNYLLIEKDKFMNRKLIAFAGIGNPNNFFDLLKENNLNLIETLSYSDHHNFLDKELDRMIKLAKNNKSMLVSTEKDYFRLKEKYRFYVEPIKIKVNIENMDNFKNFLKSFII